MAGHIGHHVDTLKDCTEQDPANKGLLSLLINVPIGLAHKNDGRGLWPGLGDGCGFGGWVWGWGMGVGFRDGCGVREMAVGWGMAVGLGDGCT